MIVTATDMANDSKAVFDRVMERNESAFVQRRGRTLFEIRRKVEISRADFLERMKANRFTAAESKELAQAIEAAAEVFDYAGSH